jgi:hypothetical protein
MCCWLFEFLPFSLFLVLGYMTLRDRIGFRTESAILDLNFWSCFQKKLPFFTKVNAYYQLPKGNDVPSHEISPAVSFMKLHAWRMHHSINFLLLAWRLQSISVENLLTHKPNNYKYTKPWRSSFLKSWPVKRFGGRCLSVWGPLPS